MKKKLVSFGMAAMMAASLAACGGSKPAETTAAADNAETTAAEGAETEAAAGAEGGTLKVGVIGPLTGAGAAYGNAVANGAELAAKEINEAGGINGMMIETKAEDDENDPEKSINAYNTLKDWGMQVLDGPTTSKPCIAVGAEAESDNMFLITPSGSAVECVATDNAFRVCFADPDQGTASAKYIGENKLAPKIAIIYDSSTEYSSGIRESFVKEAANQGIEIVADEAFTADSNKDFSTQLQKAKESGAELVFLPIYYTEASLILQQANTMGYAPQFFGCDGMDGILQVENFDVKLAEGLMLLTPFAADATDDLTVNFVKSYEEAYGETPIQFAADAYDAVYIIKAAMEEANVTPDMSASDICDAMEGVMTQIKVDGLTGSNMSWTEDGEPEKDPKAVQVVDGAYKAME